MMRKKLSLFTTLLLLFGLTACVNLKPVPSQTESFTLGPVGMQPQGDNQLSSEGIYIMRPQVPTYLDGSRLSYRAASGEVKNLPGARWAEPLSEGIARAMSLYLSGPVAVEGYYPWPNTSSESSRLSLNFQRFGATNSGEVHVVVSWSLKRTSGKVITGQYISDSLTWVVGQSDSLIVAYNQALKALASDVGDSLTRQ